MTTEQKTAEQKIEDGMREIRSAYWTMIRDDAQDFVKECREGTIADRDELLDRIHEHCDGHEWVIYTFKAQLVLLCSDNDGIGVEDGLVGPESFKDGIPWSQLAYCAMEADLMRQLDAEGLDVNDDSEWREQDETEDDAE
jgi:hypothetical protein